MRSKTKIILLCGLLVVVFVVALRHRPDPHAPRFVPGAPASIAPYAMNNYEWLGTAPFAGDRIWVRCWAGRTNNHLYLFDLKKRVVLGEMLNTGDPVAYDCKDSRLLCTGFGSSSANFKEMAETMLQNLASVLGGNVRKPDRIESFWIVDLRDGHASRVGELSQRAGTGSSWHSSPSFRYAYTLPSMGMSVSLWVCDLEKKTFAQTQSPGEIVGWWDDQHLLFDDGKNQLLLFDIADQQSRVLLTSAQVENFKAQANLTNSPGSLGCFCEWNGHEYDFYLGPRNQIRGLDIDDSIDTFLLKIDRSSPGLKLLYRHFDFCWGGNLDASGTLYLYQGESGQSGKGGNGAVYLRDLVNNTEFTVVPPDRSGQYAIPRFYGGEVIYFSNRILHRIQLNGTNDAVLLPATGK